jgi:hypothetical protein
MVIKSRRIRWTWHVASMGKIRKAYTISIGKHEGKDHLDDLGIDGKIIL